MSGEKYYKINFEKCKPEDIGPAFAVKEIIVMDGQYEADFDVVEEYLPPDICNACRYETEAAKMHIARWQGFEAEIDYMPLGVNYPLPLGAVITQILDGEI